MSNVPSTHTFGIKKNILKNIHTKLPYVDIIEIFPNISPSVSKSVISFFATIGKIIANVKVTGQNKSIEIATAVIRTSHQNETMKIAIYLSQNIKKNKLKDIKIKV